MNKLYKGVYKGEDFDTKVQKELVADLVGDYIFTDKDFVRQLSTKNRNVFQKVYDEIKYLCKVATAGSKEARELEKVKKTFAEVYRESGKVLTEGPQELYKDEKSVDENEDSADNPDMRYSVSEEVLENIEKILYDNNSPLTIVNRAKSNNNSSIKWVYKAEIFSVTENILFHEKISEINQGSQAFQKNSIDEYMLQIENKIVFTDGNYESPYISEIVEVMTESQTEFEAIKERIFDVEKGKSSKQDAVRYVQNVYGKGCVITYTSGNDGVYGWEDGRRKGKTRRAVVRNYLKKHYGRGNDNQINETKVEGDANRQASTSEVKLGNNFTDVDGAFFDANYSLSEETESIDNYTEEQYNNFGWITDNNLVSKQERETLLSRYADYKHNGDKYPTTRFGEAVIHSTECPDVIMYVKGEIGEPNVTKIVRINSRNPRTISKAKENILKNERGQIYQPYDFVRTYFGEEILAVDRKRDYESFREVKARIKRERSQESNTNSGTGQDRAGSVQQNSRIDRADLKGSAFSLSENGENPIKNGNYNIYGSDVKLEAEPTENTEDIAPVTENIAGKTYISMEDFANQEGSVWNNVDFNDDATKKSITQETHNNMVSEGSVVVVSDEVLTNVEQSFPDLRTIKKKERTPILKEAMNKLKNNIRQFLNNFKNQSFEFEVNGKVLEAKLYNTGINEVLEKVTQEKANMLYSTKDIFKNARYLYSTPDYDGDPNVYRWNYFYTPVQIGENVVGVRIAVRDLAKQGESQIYNWGIKKDTSLDGVRDDSLNRESHDVSSDVSAYSISDIAPVVNTEDVAESATTTDSSDIAPIVNKQDISAIETAEHILFYILFIPTQRSIFI